MPMATIGQNVRRSALAGTWYPGSAQELQHTVDGFLARARDGRVEGDLIGLIVPHAGYAYSGQVAAYAYTQLTDRSYDTVILVGPSHRLYIGQYAASAEEGYQTPLGLVPLDQDALSRLESLIPLERIRENQEHCLEIQLPFLQRTLKDFRLVPILMGDHSLPACQRLGDALARVAREADRSILLVASTDLSHFYDYNTARRLDSVFLARVNEFDPEGLARELETGRTEACGGGPAITVMLAARALGANKAKVLHYANSGDVTGDRWRVVGYAAGALYRAV